MGIGLEANNPVKSTCYGNNKEKTTKTLHADLPRSPNRMTASGESQRETTSLKLKVLSAKTKTRLGFWNVRTMYEIGRLLFQLFIFLSLNFFFLSCSGMFRNVPGFIDGHF